VREKKGRKDGGFHHVRGYDDIRDNPVFEESYGPVEKKQIKVMMPVSKLLRWFKSWRNK